MSISSQSIKCDAMQQAAQSEGRTVKSGMYVISALRPNAKNKLSRLDVYCDMETDGGGYTMFSVLQYNAKACFLISCAGPQRASHKQKHRQHLNQGFAG